MWRERWSGDLCSADCEDFGTISNSEMSTSPFQHDVNNGSNTKKEHNRFPCADRSLKLFDHLRLHRGERLVRETLSKMKLEVTDTSFEEENEHFFGAYIDTTKYIDEHCTSCGLLTSWRVNGCRVSRASFPRRVVCAKMSGAVRTSISGDGAIDCWNEESDASFSEVCCNDTIPNLETKNP